MVGSAYNESYEGKSKRWGARRFVKEQQGRAKGRRRTKGEKTAEILSLPAKKGKGGWGTKLNLRKTTSLPTSCSVLSCERAKRCSKYDKSARKWERKDNEKLVQNRESRWEGVELLLTRRGRRGLAFVGGCCAVLLPRW